MLAKIKKSSIEEKIITIYLITLFGIFPLYMTAFQAVYLRNNGANKTT